jgi:hypothetical protein
LQQESIQITLTIDIEMFMKLSNFLTLKKVAGVFNPKLDPLDALAMVVLRKCLSEERKNNAATNK